MNPWQPTSVVEFCGRLQQLARNRTVGAAPHLGDHLFNTGIWPGPGVVLQRGAQAESIRCHPRVSRDTRPVQGNQPVRESCLGADHRREGIYPPGITYTTLDCAAQMV